MKNSPIEISFLPGVERYAKIILAVAALFVVMALAVVGRAVTPDPARLIDGDDWRARKIAGQYERELAALRTDAESLATALDGAPDAVAASILAGRIARSHHSGLDLLANQRSAVIAAAEAVRLWAQGGLSRDEAASAVRGALEALK